MLKHIYRCPLRWSDMDAYGHVNNVVFLRYLEEARIDFLFRQPPGEGGSTFSEGSVVARTRSTTCARWCTGMSRSPSNPG